MNSKRFAKLSLLCFLLTMVWIIFKIWIAIAVKPMNSFDIVFHYVMRLDWKHYVNYINAAVLTLLISVLFAVLARSLAVINKFLAFVGFIFIPVYCTINLFIYLSQVTVVPQLIKSANLNVYSPTIRVLLTQLIHLWPDSSVAFFNSLAYSILAIPSFIYGIMLFRQPIGLRFAGFFLALFALPCFAGTIGHLINSRFLENASIVGGVFFCAALAPFFKDGL